MREAEVLISADPRVGMPPDDARGGYPNHLGKEWFPVAVIGPAHLLWKPAHRIREALGGSQALT
jgi:hypothetical protein